MSLEKVFKDVSIIGLSKILISTSSILLIPVLTKTIGAYGYGLWVQVLATISLLIPLIELGLPYSMTRFFPSKDHKQIGKDFSSILFFQFLIAGFISLILFLYPSVIAKAIFDGKIIIVRLLAVILFVWCLDKTFLSVLRSLKKMKKHALFEVSGKYFEIVLAILFLQSGLGLIGAILSILIVRVTMLLIISLSIDKIFFIDKPNLYSLKEYLKFGIPTIPANISNWVVSTSDRYLIGMFLGSSYVGYYSPGYSLGQIVPFMIGGVLGFVLTPTLSEYYEKGDIKLIKRVTNMGIKYILIFSIPYLFGSFIFSKEVLLVFTTESIANSGNIIVIYTAISGIFWALYSLFSQYLIVLKKTKLIGFFWLSAAIMNLIGNLFLVPRIGIQGAAITTVITYFLVFLFVFYFVNKYFKLVFDFISYIKIFISSSIMVVFVYLLKILTCLNYVIIIIIGILSYIFLIYCLGEIKHEIKYLLKFINII